MSNKKFQLTNLATGKSCELDALSGTVGPDVVNIGPLYKEHGVFTFDPGFMATASCESHITYIDGDAGVLLYRGYPIEQLAQHSSHLEVAYLLMYGELPNPAEFKSFHESIRRHTMLNESLLKMFDGFHYDAHPMAMVSAIVASMAA
jgi:citrate synthase